MAQASGSDTYPRPGRVTEVCREWLVHEDGALAYRLQNEEIQQHYTGNKWRNAQVREDIPRAKDEQRREMEEAALVHALHEQMLQRQEEIDAQVAQQLAEKIDREEYARRRQAEERDKEIAWQMQPPSPPESSVISQEMNYSEDLSSPQERERIRLERLREERERVHIVEGANGPMVVVPDSPPEMASPPVMQPPLMQRMVFQQHSSPVQRAQHYSPKMAVTRTNQMLYTDEDVAAELGALDLGSPQHRWQVNHPLREEHGDFYQAGLSPDEDSEFGVPEMSSEEAKRIQEEQDAELARLLQEQEGKRGGGNGVDALDRDRLLAVEAQDRELARMLQEKERAKARRARERGKQRALLKKQQQMEQQQQQMLESGAVNGHDEEDEPEYGTVVSNGTDNEMESPRKTTLSSHSSPHGTSSRAERPTELDLSGSSRSSRVSTGVKAKPRQRYPDPEAIEVLPASVGASDSPSMGSSSHCANIAMAIDPTYPRSHAPSSPNSLSRGSSSPAVVVSGIVGSASSSPGMSLPPPDFEDDDSPAPPYMPIQGQRRTSSLEKKGKKGKQKDGCRQQ